MKLKWVDFGCDNIHSGPTCCEQTGTVSNCYSISYNNNIEFHGVVGGVGGPKHYVVTPTRVEVELRLSGAVTIPSIKL